MKNSFVRLSVVGLGLIIALGGCTQGRAPAGRVSLSEKLKLDEKAASSAVDYVIGFTSQKEAEKHAQSVTQSGGQVAYLDHKKLFQRVLAERGAVGSLNVPSQTLLNLNTEIKINRPPASRSSAQVSPEELLTVRNVVGVDKLLAKVPEADGRGVKVAVFDTGTDFGVQGVQNFSTGETKLVGFYDFTDFGRVAPTVLASSGLQDSYKIGEDTLTFVDGVQPQAVQSVGVLSEAEVAKNYLTPQVDFENNGEFDDTYNYAVGINAANQPAVWLDINHDGVFTPATEELTDYNTTYKYIDLRTDVGPSGAKPIAVTITSPNDIQFHSLQGGHGTSCSIIIAADLYANGNLRGLAPKAQLMSYTLDTTGQDVYTLDQFMKMFLHARDQGAEAISISWGFSTADLDSAKFVSGFLDQEIADKGVLIAIAAGNEGPGISSAVSDDYIPEHGFGVGAHLSKVQAQHVYGWAGAKQDSVIWYSSFGPTRGLRQMPDVISPLASLVRSERLPEGDQFYPFSGTSSATPALVGASTALMSALKHAGEAQINMRLLKLAIQNSASKLDDVMAIRQGAGLIDVSAAYDIYLKLSQELKAAQANPAKNTAFAYEIKGQGIHADRAIESAELRVALTAESKALLDPLTFIDTLEVVHQSDFFTAPEVLTLQAQGGAVAFLQFDMQKLSVPGTYSDLIELRRSSDHLTLAWIPIVVEVPVHLDSDSSGVNLLGTLKPFDLWRKTVKLDEAGSISFSAMVQDAGGGQNGRLGIHIVGAEGITIHEALLPLTQKTQTVEFESPSLAAGVYELVVFRHFGRPAVLSDVSILGGFMPPRVKLLAIDRQDNKLNLAIQAKTALQIQKAEVAVNGITQEVTLTRDLTQPRPGYFGSVVLPNEADSVKVGLRQTPVSFSLERMLHMSVALINADTGQTMQRGWVNVEEEGSPLSDLELLNVSRNVSIIAYPNIVHWPQVQTEQIRMQIFTPLAEALRTASESIPEDTLKLKKEDKAQLVFELPGGLSPDGAQSATLDLFDLDGKKISSSSFDF